MCSICNESNLQQQFTNCTFCNSNIHQHCAQTNAAALELQNPVCTTCINGSQTNWDIKNCFVCNTNEGIFLICQQCTRLRHGPCIIKLGILVTGDTFLCPWCTPTAPYTHQPAQRHTDSDDAYEGGDDSQPIVNNHPAGPIYPTKPAT